MLGWLAAAAAPLLIHLWSRRRYREVPWAAVTFLLAAMRKNSRRIQLQQWILLAVRTLMVLFVVLALAEPRGQNLAAGVGGVPTHKVIVIDTSFSMAYRENDESLLAKAKKLAEEMVEQSGGGDAFTVITLSDRPRQSCRARCGGPIVDRRTDRGDSAKPGRRQFGGHARCGGCSGRSRCQGPRPLAAAGGLFRFGPAAVNVGCGWHRSGVLPNSRRTPASRQSTSACRGLRIWR